MDFAIQNYGVGNLYSLRTAFGRLGVRTVLTRKARDMRQADAIILPGVGGFRVAAEGMDRGELLDLAESGKPVIGICLGMQLFLERSEEGPGEGLGFFRGVAKRFPPRLKVPQMGWNTVQVSRETELTDGLPEESWVYYANSYYPATAGDWVVATSEYGLNFPAIIQERNVIGTQFHPEKSGKTGRKILQNIVKVVR